jgi:hypothetical protein
VPVPVPAPVPVPGVHTRLEMFAAAESGASSAVAFGATWLPSYQSLPLPLTHCTALHCAALHCTALHCTALAVLSHQGLDGTKQSGLEDGEWSAGNDVAALHAQLHLLDKKTEAKNKALEAKLDRVLAALESRA